MPTRIELASLVDPSRSPAIDTIAFPGTAPGRYWTLSEEVRAGQALPRRWMVDFGDGKASLNDENAGQRVRCVRVFEGHAGTGRVVSAGAPPEQYQRFNAADTAIKDKKTRLCWERPPPPEPMWKQEAEKHCREEPPEGCSSAYRLPAVKELMTLVDEQSVPVLADGWLGNRAIDGNAFPNTPAESFWTSTPKRIGPDVWGIRFDTGEMTELSTNSTARYYVRCVTQE